MFESHEGRRGVLPYIYTRPLDGGRSERQPGSSRGRTGLPGPTSMDLYGDNLSFSWRFARADSDQGEGDNGTTGCATSTPTAAAAIARC